MNLNQKGLIIIVVSVTFCMFLAACKERVVAPATAPDTQQDGANVQDASSSNSNQPNTQVPVVETNVVDNSKELGFCKEDCLQEGNREMRSCQSKWDSCSPTDQGCQGRASFCNTEAKKGYDACLSKCERRYGN
jgi:hypothetical protein